MEQIQDVIQHFLESVSTYQTAIAITLVIIIVQFFLVKSAIPIIEKKVVNSNLKLDVFLKAKKSLVLITVILSLSLITLVWGFGFRGLMTVSASLIALLGVSLFAGWSILSNVTAFFFLIFHKSYSRGSFVRVILGENYIEGYISEINLFNTKLITEDKEIIIYPNTLFLLNPVIINSKKRYSAVGKISEFMASESHREL